MSVTPFSRNYHCRISDALHYCGLQMIVMENSLLKVIIFPEKGGEIYSIQYKQLDLDPLLHYRALQTPTVYPPTIPLSDGSFSDVYDGGWQVMFPTAGGAGFAMGTGFGRHGEAALLPWHWRIVDDQPERVSVRLFVTMMRSPFVLERTISLEEGKAQLSFVESVTNQGGERQAFVWGHHPAFGAPFLDGSCVLDVPADFVETSPHESDAARVPAGIKERWSLISGKTGDEIDLRLIPDNGLHTTDMLFLTGLKEGWYALTNRRLGLGFALTWEIDIFPVLWVWQELGGSRGSPWHFNTYALGLEPCTSYSIGQDAGLDGYIQTGQAKWLEPGETLSTRLRAVLYPFATAQGVSHVSPEGDVILF